MVAGATAISASEGEGQQGRRRFVAEGLPDVKITCCILAANGKRRPEST